MVSILPNGGTGQWTMEIFIIQIHIIMCDVNLNNENFHCPLPCSPIGGGRKPYHGGGCKKNDSNINNLDEVWRNDLQLKTLVA